MSSLEQVGGRVVMPIKQVIVIRKDLNMRKGKMVAQGAHAAMMFLLGLTQSFSAGSTETNLRATTRYSLS